MKKLLFLQSFILLILINTACSDFFVSDVKGYDIPGQKPKLVIQCFISPDDSNQKVWVWQSNPVFVPDTNNNGNYSSLPVKNAIVTLIENDQRYLYQYDENSMGYIPASNFPELHAGSTYQLEVTAPGLEKVSASTTMPVNVPQSAHIDTIETATNPDYGYQEDRYSCYFRDIAGETNHYSASLDIMGRFPDSSLYLAVTLQSEQGLITDEEKDGELIKLTFKFTHGMIDGVNLDSMATMNIYVMDEPSWLYNTSLKKTFQSNSTQNPFAEPVIMYSNITNGLGIFGSYRKLKVPINIYEAK
jgi:hypothetical protein